MSTLPGLASKGEKGKSKYQSLDINSLYKVTLGESTEKQQQKSILSHKHGMQLLGKVPSARRPPANLPSLKSEHSGSDAAVSLVPSNGSGWGKQESVSSSTSTTTTTNVSSAGAANATNTTSAHQANIALPVSTNPALQQQQQQGAQQQIQQQQQQSMPASAVAGGAKQQPQHHQQQIQQQQHGANPATGDKSWSSVMSGGEPSAHPPSYQSLMFEHEFPSLSAGDGGAPRSGTVDTQYGPGPSLRPQTEGSWQLGGGAAAGAARTDGIAVAPGGAVASGPQRNGSAPHGAPPSHMGQGGPPLPQYRGFVPTFMYKGGGNVGPAAPGQQQQPPYQNNAAGPPSSSAVSAQQQQSNTSNATVNSNSTNQSTIRRQPQQQQRNNNNQHHETESSLHRPIIKEEELSGMDNLTSDMGWAMHDDIDYNQKLAFSDDEADSKSRGGGTMPKMDIQKSDFHHHQQQQLQHAPQEYHQHHHHQDYHHHQSEHKPWSRQQSSMHSEEDEMNAKRRRQQQEVASARERARLRKEEEEKKFYQAKQNKYKDMDEKIQQGKPSPVKDDQANAPAATAPILLPEWERPKESEQEQQQQQQQQQPQQPVKNDFRQLTQIEGRATYTRKDQRSGGGGGSSEKDTQAFKRQYQHNLPPRFLKRQQEMNGGQQQLQQNSLSSSSSGGNGFSFESNRWVTGGGAGGMNKTSPGNRKNHRNDNESEKDDDYNKYNYGRHRTYGGGNQQNNAEVSGRKSVGDDYEYNNRKDDNSRQQQNNDDWQERRMERYGSSDRPQRPDSRDSRASRESRHSEPREYSSWAETHFEEDTKRQQVSKEHKMQVPGPITKDKLEADDLRNEKQRNLTQLKRGEMVDNKSKSLEKTPEKEEDIWCSGRIPKVWAEALLTPPSPDATENPKFAMDVDKKAEDKSADCDDKKDDKSKNVTGRGRSDSQNSRTGNNGSANGGNVYNRNMWSKKGSGGAAPPQRGGNMRSSLSRSSLKSGGDWQASESEGSADDVTLQHHNEEQSPKLNKKTDSKDERSKDAKSDKAPSNCITSEKKAVGAGYVPRGEPSRHGRGGGGSSSFRGGRGGCKRMDGYGLPPVKSPFPHEEQQMTKKLDVDEMDDKKKSQDMNKRKDALNKKKTGREGGDVSDNSDDIKDKNRKPKQQQRQQQQQASQSAAMPGSGSQRSRAPAASPRMSSTTVDKRGFSQSQLTNSSMPPRMKDDKSKDLVNSMTEMNLSEEAKPETEQQPGEDGFQEVKSKKSLEKRPKSTEMKQQQPTVKTGQIDAKDNSSKVMIPAATKPKPVHNLSQQQIANIPSLMATPVNPPPNMPQPQSNKGPFERPRQNKLPPRLVKQRENNRLHKAQMQQQCLNANEINDMNKMAQNMQQHYGMKDGGGAGGGNAACNLGGMANAWEKPLGQLREANAPDVLHALDINQKDPNCKQSTDAGDKVLDGSNPLKTIIFENTNYKSAPGCRNRNNDKRGSGSKPSSLEDNNGMEMNFGNKQIGELLNNKTGNDKSDINMLAFDADKAADIKLDFFENEISHLTEDKGSKLPRTMHTITSSNNTISPSTADALNIKIQSVKKVWEMPTVIEVQQQQQHQQQDEAYASSFCPDPNGMDQGFTNKSGDGNGDDNHEGYSPSSNNANSNNTTNVCKVKPTQQVAGSGGQSTVINTVSSGASSGERSGASSSVGGGSSTGGAGGNAQGGGGSSGHQQHSTMVGPNLMGHPLSPPPQMPTVISALGPQPQQYTTNQHLGYQTAGLGGNTQYGIPAIPSPPTVLYNSSQQMPQSGLYGTFQLDQSQVLNSQGRSQYSQYSYGLGQTASSPYSAQSMYLQTQQHGPPTGQGPPDIYPNYRLPGTGPFGQNQQLNNPTTVLISSTSNSLMSATVKPSGQQISAIGTKAGGVGQAYQQQSQQGQQLYMTYDPNYMQNTGVMQRGPPPPPQNSVVPGLQPSSSYYSGSTGGQTAGYFQQPPPGNSSQMAPPPPQHQHQAGYGLQGSVFGTHSQSPHTGTAGLQNFNSPFLSGPMMAAMNAQQYRSAVAAAAASNMPPNAAVAAPYMKGGNQQMEQQGGRSQQLRSPGSQQEVLASVFNSASQIPSPKSRQSCKQPQPSPTAPNKSGYLYQNVTNAPSGQSRYPAPIQRPNSNYGISSMQNNGQKHGGRPNNSGNRSASRQYYSSQGVGLNNQVDKSEDSKLVEGGANKLGAANQQPGGGASDKIDVGKDVENSAKD